MTPRFTRYLAAPDHEEIRGWQIERRAVDLDEAITAAIFAFIVVGLTVLAIWNVSFDRPSFCKDFPSAAECSAAAAERVR